MPLRTILDMTPEGRGIDWYRKLEYGEERRRMSEAETVIREIIAARAGAVNAGDVDGIVADLAEDVMIFDVVGPLRGDGKAWARRRAEEWLAAYEEGPTWENRDIHVASGEAVAFSHSLSHVTGRLKGGTRVDMWFRTTLGFERRDGRWLILHDHGSDPFDPETGKASLDLNPDEVAAGHDHS
jgi:uncharacterized protein (TIGR02246 family)